MKKYSNKEIFNSLNKGFTLIETMVAVGLFTIIVSIGTTAVLNVNTTYNKTSNQREVIDTVNFIMEDMARNLRLGTNFHCIKSDLNEDLTVLQDCDPDDTSNGRISAIGVAFEKFKGDPNIASDQQAYFLARKSIGGNNAYSIRKTTDGGATSLPLTPDSVEIDPLRSGFFVVNSSKTDGFQPKVVIQLNGSIKGRGFDTPFSLQTTVSQRLLDL